MKLGFVALEASKEKIRENGNAIHSAIAILVGQEGDTHAHTHTQRPFYITNATSQYDSGETQQNNVRKNKTV